MTTPAPSMLPWEVLEALKDHFAKITTGNGYLTNIGKQATTEPPPELEPANLPSLEIRGTPNFQTAPGSNEEKPISHTGSFAAWGMDVVIESHIPIEQTRSRNLAWKVLADLIEASKSPRGFGLPKRAHSARLVNADIIDPVPGQPFITVQLVLYVGLVTN